MIAISHEGPLDIVTLQGPKRNALSLAMMRELIAALTACTGRVVILAAGGPAFCAGHDLTEITGCTAPAAEEIFTLCTDLMLTIQAISRPVIAAVQGVATAAGCQLVATCDLAIAAEEAWVATPGVQLGLFCSTPMVALTRAIGRKRAMEMLLTARPVDARTAAEWGLVNRVVRQAELAVAVRELALTIAAGSEYTVSLGKPAVYEQVDLPVAPAHDYASRALVGNPL